MNPTRSRPLSTGDTRSTTRRVLWRAGALAVAAALLLAAGCARAPAPGSPPAPPAAATPSAPATASDPVVAAAEQALSAYRGMWRAYRAAGATGGRGDTGLAEHASGRALATLDGGLASLRARDLVVRGRITIAPVVAGLSPAPDPTTVEVRDCVRDATLLTPRTVREPVDDVPAVRRLVLATVTRTGAGWRVSDLAVQAVGTC